MRVRVAKFALHTFFFQRLLKLEYHTLLHLSECVCVCDCVFEVLLTVTKKLQNSTRRRKKTLRSAQVQVATKQQPHSGDAACHTKGSTTYEKLTMIIFFVCVYFRKTCKRKEIRKQTVSVCKRERERNVKPEFQLLLGDRVVAATTTTLNI